MLITEWIISEESQCVKLTRVRIFEYQVTMEITETITKHHPSTPTKNTGSGLL